MQNAQLYGASLLIVVDYDPKSNQAQGNIKLDEREGNLLPHIPVFEISYADFKLIEKQQVVLKADLTLSNPTNQVEVDLWYTSSLDLGLKLSDELAALSYSF